ncbi:hypothetical protein MRX96_007995 [Rhipicephalus microplus]
MAPFKCAPALRWSEADKCNFPGTRSVDLELGLEYPLEAPRRLDPKRPPERLLERGASSALSIRSLLRRLKLVRKVEVTLRVRGEGCRRLCVSSSPPLTGQLRVNSTQKCKVTQANTTIEQKAKTTALTITSGTLCSGLTSMMIVESSHFCRRPIVSLLAVPVSSSPGCRFSILLCCSRGQRTFRRLAQTAVKSRVLRRWRRDALVKKCDHQRYRTRFFFLCPQPIPHTQYSTDLLL